MVVCALMECLLRTEPGARRCSRPDPSDPFVLAFRSWQRVLYLFYPTCLEATLGLIKLIRCGRNLLILGRDGGRVQQLRL